MPEILWCGPGWYKRLNFAVGNSKVVQASQNKGANLDSECVWCGTISEARLEFGPKPVKTQSKREVY